MNTFTRLSVLGMIAALGLTVLTAPALATVEEVSYEVATELTITPMSSADLLAPKVEKLDQEAAEPAYKEILLAPGICIDRRRSCNKSIDVESELTDAAAELVALSRSPENPAAS